MFANLRHSVAGTLLGATGLMGCHVDAPCEPSMPPGVHLQVTVLDVLLAASGPECEKIAITTDDEFGIATGVAFAGGADDECLMTSAEGPPEFSNSLSFGSCRPFAALGSQCDVVRSDCDYRASLETYLSGRDDFDVGQSREMIYHVSLSHAQPGCPRISCSNEYRVQVTRVD